MENKVLNWLEAKALVEGMSESDRKQEIIRLCMEQVQDRNGHYETVETELTRVCGNKRPQWLQPRPYLT